MTISKKDLKVGDTVTHCTRGIGKYTEQCKHLELTNPDPSSTFIELVSNKEISTISLGSLRFTK